MHIIISKADPTYTTAINPNFVGSTITDTVFPGFIPISSRRTSDCNALSKGIESIARNTLASSVYSHLELQTNSNAGVIGHSLISCKTLTFSIYVFFEILGTASFTSFGCDVEIVVWRTLRSASAICQDIGISADTQSPDPVIVTVQRTMLTESINKTISISDTIAVPIWPPDFINSTFWLTLCPNKFLPRHTNTTLGNRVVHLSVWASPTNSIDQVISIFADTAIW